jgi:hypothetical protein
MTNVFYSVFTLMFYTKRWIKLDLTCIYFKKYFSQHKLILILTKSCIQIWVILLFLNGSNFDEDVEANSVSDQVEPWLETLVVVVTWYKKHICF